jgi:hypothetical protein
LLEFGPKLAKIVDLPIECDGEATAWQSHRLVTRSGEIENRKASVGKAGHAGGRRPSTAIIWPTMFQSGLQHSETPIGIR